MSKRSIVILAIVSCALIAAAIGAAVYFSRPARIVERPQEMAIATPAARTLGLAKAAQAGKRVIPAGLYFYGNPFISNNVSPWFQQNWMSVPEVKGTVIEVLWRQIEPIQEQYNWTTIDTYVGRIHAWNAAHPDMLKYWILRIHVYQDATCNNSTFTFPQWAKYFTIPNASICANGGLAVPDYADKQWQTRFRAMVAEAGKRYDSDTSLAFVQIAVGLYGERQPAKNESPWDNAQNALYDGKMLSACGWQAWVEWAMDSYHAAFPQTQMVLMNAPAYNTWCSYGANTYMDRYHNELHALQLNPPIGFQNNSLDEWDGKELLYWRQSNISNYGNTWIPAGWTPEYTSGQWVRDATVFWGEGGLHPVPDPPLAGSSWRDVPVAYERGSWGVSRVINPATCSRCYNSYETILNGLAGGNAAADVIFPNNYARKNADGTGYDYPAGLFAYTHDNPNIAYKDAVQWMIDFAEAHLGVDERTTPDVWWVAFNSPYFFGNGNTTPFAGYGWDAQHWDREFFLYRMDVAKNPRLYGAAKYNGMDLGAIPNDNLVSEWGKPCYNTITRQDERCPGPIPNQTSDKRPYFSGQNVPPYFEGDYVRRTNVATGDTRAYFDIDDDYHFNVAGEKWEVQFRFYGNSADPIYFRYYDAAGARKVYRVPVQNTKTWLDVTFTLDDFVAANRGQYGEDFYLDIGDSKTDHYFHRLILKAIAGGGGTSAPTQTSAPTIAPTATLVVSTPTPTATPAWRPTPTLDMAGGLFLQQGYAGYAGASDTTISIANQDINFGRDETLRVGNGYVSLLSFDCSPVLAGAEVLRATLRLYVRSRLGIEPLPVAMHAMARAWDAFYATWVKAGLESYWTAPGALDDMSPALADARLVDSAGGEWYAFDMTDTMRKWAEQPAYNYGVLLRSGGEGSDVMISSDDAPVVSERPALIINYIAPTETAPTATPIWTATATAIPTMAVTVTVTPTPPPASKPPIPVWAWGVIIGSIIVLAAGGVAVWYFFGRKAN